LGFYFDFSIRILFLIAGIEYACLMKKTFLFIVFSIMILPPCFSQSTNNELKFIGTWIGENNFTWSFNYNGTLIRTWDIPRIGSGTSEWKWGVTDTKLAIADTKGDSLQVYDISISSDGKTLILSGHDSSGRIILHWLTKK